MTIDRYERNAQSVSAPASACFPITPSDTLELSETTKAIYVGIGGSVTLRATGSTADVTFVGVPAGCILPVRADIVRLAGTTASGLVGLA
jgi:hypothetical protein